MHHSDSLSASRIHIPSNFPLVIPIFLKRMNLPCLLSILFLIIIAIIRSWIIITAIIVIPYCSILLTSCVLYTFLLSTFDL